MASAQNTIRLLEVKVVELQQLVQATQEKVDDQQKVHQAAIKEVMESMRGTEREREKERRGFVEMINEWKKGVEWKWTSVQEEWGVERDRLRRARDEWESKTKTIEDSVLARVESRLPPIQPRHSGSGTSSGSQENSHWTNYEADDEEMAQSSHWTKYDSEDEEANPQNAKTARKNGRLPSHWVTPSNRNSYAGIC